VTSTEAESFYQHCYKSLNNILQRIASCNDPKIRRALISEFYSWIFFSLEEQVIIYQTTAEVKRLYESKNNKTNKLEN
tara:strand:+ start:143 stop:376 length:234 start_codon:yes stop_codon:yes gene_type:complete